MMNIQTKIWHDHAISAHVHSGMHTVQGKPLYGSGSSNNTPLLIK